MVDWKVLGRGRMWLNVLLGAVLLSGLALGIVKSRAGGDPAAAAAAGDDAPVGPVAAAPERGEPTVVQALTARRAFMSDCAKPTRSRERIRLEHLFESGCISQLSTALAARVGDSAEARKLLAEHRANVDSTYQGGWSSREQPRRVRDALLSAAGLMEKLSRASADAGPELGKEIAGARKAALSIRQGVPLAEQTERTDAFFRHAGEALRLMGERSE